MTNRRILLAVAVVVAALLVVGLWLRRDRAGAPSPEPGPERAQRGIRADDVTVVSPELDVRLVEIRGTVHPDYTDWSCILECREAEVAWDPRAIDDEGGGCVPDLFPKSAALDDVPLGRVHAMSIRTQRQAASAIGLLRVPNSLVASGLS